ncbi:MAG: hypothetical protein ACK47B_04225 [Armatimonadota bacterium]
MEAKSQPWTLQPAEKSPSAGQAQPNERSTEPTLEEDAAYQHAVLTAALGEKDAARAEFMQFLRDFPESPLVHAAARRLVKLHGDHVPKEVETAYQQATRTAQAREQARERERSLCAPEVLAELLRRRSGESAAVPTVEELAKELGTTHLGTTLKSLAAGARRHGLQAKGLQLSWDGLVAVMQGRGDLEGSRVQGTGSSQNRSGQARSPGSDSALRPSLRGGARLAGAPGAGGGHQLAVGAGVGPLRARPREAGGAGVHPGPVALELGRRGAGALVSGGPGPRRSQVAGAPALSAAAGLSLS